MVRCLTLHNPSSGAVRMFFGFATRNRRCSADEEKLRETHCVSHSSPHRGSQRSAAPCCTIFASPRQRECVPEHDVFLMSFPYGKHHRRRRDCFCKEQPLRRVPRQLPLHRGALIPPVFVRLFSTCGFPVRVFSRRKWDDSVFPARRRHPSRKSFPPRQRGCDAFFVRYFLQCRYIKKKGNAYHEGLP